MIRLLTVQHEQIINKLGEVRRACESGVEGVALARELAVLLAAHNKLEENGLFDALMPDREFVGSLEKLRVEHSDIDGLVKRIILGEFSVVGELEVVLRNNISNEENGIFPASAVTLDGSVWDEIEVAQGIVS